MHPAKVSQTPGSSLSTLLLGLLLAACSGFSGSGFQRSASALQKPDQTSFSGEAEIHGPSQARGQMPEKRESAFC
ncbi:hypothetical protein K402DRAFT_394799 [Aulographum hederae CBS 113979]|uniref:Uncharacterized protein n=1 Tax=Aulographum hederae CBS 113979 TaxID=1176131 RepID=A0A6G1GXE8_9PEZI|nr:hypothetical protein K402DRAFT_394799 [Aulographum hederae CBS 113979]